jgi:hypothetical protein
MGRPTKLTPSCQDRIIQALRAGNHREPAARAAGIAPSTFYAWLERGAADPPDSPYAGFAEAVQRAEAEAEVYAVAVIRQAMSEDWRAAVSYLERRHPGRWRRQSSTELTGKDGGPIKTSSEHHLDLTSLTDDELKFLEELHARTNSPGS